MEEIVPFIEGVAEAQSWDLFGSGMNLVIVVPSKDTRMVCRSRDGITTDIALELIVARRGHSIVTMNS